MPVIGEKARIHCRGTLSDGRVFCDTHGTDGPLSFVVGSKTLLPGIERAVLDMTVGEKLHLRIPTNEAYGDYDESLVEQVPLASIPDADRLPSDGYIVVEAGGEPVRVRIVKQSDGTVLLDHNHELAGQDLVFDIEYLGLIEETAVEHEEHAPDCGCGCDRLKRSLAAK